MKRIIIIGSGNVAEALVRALSHAGLPPVQVFARDHAKAARMAAICGCPFSTDPHDLMPADLYIIAVTDKAIRTAAGQMDFSGGVVAHTAGSVGMDVFPPNVRNAAVFYPLQTFTRGRDIDFRKVPVLIEAKNSVSLQCVREVAAALSDTVVEVDSKKRGMIHLAAVFVNNFTNYMYTVGEELTREAGFDFGLLKPLILETADKALDSPSPSDVQTGPAVRNDFQTRASHCEMLTNKPYLQNIYISISKNIWETSKKT